MKNIKVIYPSDYFNKKEVDEAFKEESECFRNNGFFVTTIDSKNIEQGYYYLCPFLNALLVILLILINS